MAAVNKQRHMPSVVMIFSRKASDDPRVLKEARVLHEAGFRVTVLDWDRRLTAPSVEQHSGVTVEHISLRSDYDAGGRQAPLMLWFHLCLLLRLWHLRPAIVHCHDLETTPPAWLYARLCGARFVLEAREYYPGMMAAKVPGWMTQPLRWLDDFIAPRADLLITIGERLAEHYRERGARAVFIVGNYPPLPGDDLSPAAAALRTRLAIPPEAPVVAYVGILTPEREIVPLIEAVGALEHWHAIIAGYGVQADTVEQLSQRVPRLRFLGRVALAEVLTIITAADVIYYGLTADNRNHYFSTPNSLFNAMAAGRALLTTDVGEVSDIVRRECLGVVLPAATAEAVRAGLLKLTDASFRRPLAARARRLAETRYNWGQAAEMLVSAYRSFTPQAHGD